VPAHQRIAFVQPTGWRVRNANGESPG